MILIRRMALLGAGAWSETAENAAAAIEKLACDSEANADAIYEAGGIAPLVALLEAGVECVAAARAAAAIRSLAGYGEANADAICEAGGIAPLVALLGAGAESENFGRVRW